MVQEEARRTSEQRGKLGVAPAAGHQARKKKQSIATSLAKGDLKELGRQSMEFATRADELSAPDRKFGSADLHPMPHAGRASPRGEGQTDMMRLGCFVLLFVGAASAKKIVVDFPDRGPAYPIGTITLTQNKGGPLRIETNLQRLENSDAGNTWHGKRQRRPP